jgi:hypothetical protein
MKQSQVSSLMFQVGVAAVAAVNFKLQTSNFKLSALILALGAVLALMPAVASPQVANDPTRPPGGSALSDPGGDGGGGLTLQSVMISPAYKAAMINGVMVKVGEKYGDAVLISVAENQVVLKSGGTEQVLRFYSAVEKREVKPVVAKSEVKPAVVKKAPRQGKTRSAAEPAAAGGTPGQ